MREPRVENKYSLTPEIIRKLKTAKPEELSNEKYFWKNQNYPGKGCVSAEIGPYEDAHFFLLVGEEGVEDFSVTVMMLCSYNFTAFYDYRQIENEYDLRIQEIILEKVNRLLDDGILEFPKDENGNSTMYEVIPTKKLIQLYLQENSRADKKDATQKLIEKILHKRFSDTMKLLGEENSTEKDILLSLFGEETK